MKILLILVFITSCSHKATTGSPMKIQFFDFQSRVEGTVSVEAFSGLTFEGKNSDGDYVFWSHTDRGPNADSDKNNNRPFVSPEFQPRLTQFKVNRNAPFATYLQVVPLALPNGKPMTGLPNKKTDETPVALDMQVLPFDPMGIDPEAICFSGEHIWLAEEYGPSLLKFNRQGQLITRYVPPGSFAKGKRPASVKEILPNQLLTRKLNRGFEGMTCLAGKIYAAIQSPLPGDGKNILIVEFDPYEERVHRSFYYPLESMDADKIGDLAHHDGKLLVLEQNSKTGPDSFHRIYEIDPNETQQLGVAKKSLFLDLVKVGYDFADKVEGMIMIDSSHIAIINDNDFGLVGSIDAATKTAVIDPKKRTRLALIKID
jgi:hypothetical protein